MPLISYDSVAYPLLLTARSAADTLSRTTRFRAVASVRMYAIDSWSVEVPKKEASTPPMGRRLERMVAAWPAQLGWTGARPKMAAAISLLVSDWSRLSRPRGNLP